MNEPGREGGETRKRREQRGRVSEKIILERKEMCDQIDSVIRLIYDKLSFKCVSCVFIFSRAGLNLLEEKARHKMSNHGFNSLSAAQVGLSAVSPGSSTHTDNHFLLIMFFFFPFLDISISGKELVNN